MNKEEYIKIMNIISGTNTFIDANRIIECIGKKDDEVINNILRSKKFDNGVLNFVEINDIIEKVNKLTYIDEYEIFIREIIDTKKISDLVQLNVLNRIGNSKLFRSYDGKITKKCPHCNHLMTMIADTTYVVCGYINETVGFDGSGCQRDWCFKCGKKLCKSWGENELYINKNREHDGKCCKMYAIFNNEDFEKEYCHCGIYILMENNES